MIDRKTLWIVWVLVAAMLAAAAWRVSLLADWTQLPRYGANGVAISPVNSAILLLMPAGVLFSMARLTWRARLAKDPGEKLRPWKKWASVLLLPISVMLTLLQAYLITRSLGLFLTMNSVLIVRGFLIVTGLLSMATSNALPKLPWLRSRIALLDLNPDQGARFLRFCGWVGVAIGLLVILIALFLPFQFIVPVIFSLAAVGVMIRLAAYRFSAKRGQPQ